ncbi:hypothetical protein PF005_g530 [Phytophthora fragariae]|uniref:Uncharacterized protein n=1 Tax=Phytophthora fragariae TaxID=53985 RepID=A0A6A3ZM06_9STRA|nr:hypothetical protein PF003_g10017 [Phytophthora fragariae]KAE8949932.1 hypothetical protein PF009_g536 [Phytophthora fragariae]KAE8992077.1 hypothetical protein PF011_g17686 [Phytophthora fragariae]KAE9139761.1 hypothetical protein PF010_g488 [Phytophthora fragariae]KAE9140763.1 hypothetical protein PF007_g539 [Phytophthora fragariae]
MARCGRAICEALILMGGWRGCIGGRTCGEKWPSVCAGVTVREPQSSASRGHPAPAQLVRR